MTQRAFDLRAIFHDARGMEHRELLPPAPDAILPTLADPFNRSDERSLINLVPPELQEAFIDAYRARPDLFGLSESELKKKLRSEERTPDVTDNRIRVMFWHEYDLAQDNNRAMKVEGTLSRVCSKYYFYSHYLKDPGRVAWLLTMPVTYENKMKEMLEFSLEQMRDILAIDHCPGGKPNTRLMEIKAKIHALVEIRERGAVVQRVEQKNMNLSVTSTATAKEISQLAQIDAMEVIEKRIKELEGKDRASARLQERYGPKDTGAGVQEADYSPLPDPISEGS